MDALVPTNVEQLIAYLPGKPVEELERELGIQHAVKLASNESPLGPSPKVVEEIRRLASESHRYPDAGTFALRAELAAHHDIPADEFCIGNGSNELIDLLSWTFNDGGDHVVFGDPSFVCYWLAALKSNVPFTKAPLRDHVHWDVQALLDAVRPETKVLFVANPNNPTGSYINAADMEGLLEELPERVVAVVDEAYAQFPDADDYRSALTMRSARERLVVLRTFSKAYGLAALRVGYAVAPPDMVGYLNRVRAPFNVGSLGQAAARVALADQEHVRRYVAMNNKQRTRLMGAFAEFGLEAAPSQANFILLNCKRPGKEVYGQLLRMGVIVRPMPPPIDTSLRITIGLPEENDRLLGAIGELLAS